MPAVNKTFTFSAGTTIIAAQHNTNLDTLYNLVNGAIDSTNIASNAAIADTQLAQLTTAGKVNISALTVGSQATGDIICAASSSTWQRVAVGTSSQMLIGGTTPSFGALPSGALTASNALTGSIVQVVNTQTGTYATGSTAMNMDNDAPINTEGDQYMTLAITPKSATNYLRITVVFNYGVATANRTACVALFQDSTANAIAVGGMPVIGSLVLMACATFSHYMLAGTTSSTTFKVRAGSNDGSALYFNSFDTTSSAFGGVVASSITIEEIKG